MKKDGVSNKKGGKMTSEDYVLLEITMGNFVTIISSSRQECIKGSRMRVMNLTVAE